MFKVSEKKAYGSITDPVSKAIDVFLKYCGSAMKERYSGLEDLQQDLNGLFQTWVKGIQDNFDRVFQDVSSRPSAYNVDLVGGADAGDFVNEHAMGNGGKAVNENEDQFADPNEQQNNKDVDQGIKNVFNDDEEEGGAITPQ